MITRVKYTGSTPGTDSSTYVLFSTVTSFGMANALQCAGLSRVVILIDHVQSGTWNLYRSSNRGTTWTQLSTNAVGAPAATDSTVIDVMVEAFQDFKIEWVNGGTAQNPWTVDISLVNERSYAGDFFSSEMRRLGAIAHFDPSSGATDNGTTSTWVDRIGGYSVASTSQATRMTYSTGVSGLNNRPGWTGVAASSTKLTGAATLADALDVSVAYTMYTVSISSNLAASNAIAGIGSTTLDSYAFSRHLATTGGIDYARSSAGAFTVNSGVVLNSTAACVSSVVYSGTAVSVWANGSPDIVAGANVRAGVCDRFVVGAALTTGSYTQFLNGSLGDVIVFLGTHTDATRMYIERLIAAKYGWPVLQGVSGFSAANYAKTENGAGIRGATGVGVWHDMLIRCDAISATTQYLWSATTSATPTGTAIASSGANAPTQVVGRNSITTAVSPTQTIVAADVGKLMMLGGSVNGSLVQHFRNGTEVGAGTALAGYTTAAASEACIVGRESYSGLYPPTNYTVFGLAGGDVGQTAANQAARIAAIKAANGFIATGGAAATHGWAFNSAAASYSDLVGSDAMTTQGSFTAAQIIVPTWPW